ncbi:MAG: peptidase U35 phage prohead HK97 [Rhodospirillaceae bacterium]|nr:MAG: peptidase U35 phage prohead HK97 [Rhodospirillaceae bacterium]
MTLLKAGAGTGPILNDGLPVFHTTHSNIAAAGAAIGDATLTVARVAMRKQTGLAGGIVSVTPRFLIVPPDLEVIAEKWV